MTIIQLSLWANKVCRQCQTTKPLADFGAQPRNRDGLQSYCRDCNRDRKREYEKRNSEVVRLYEKRNHERISKEKSAYRKRHSKEYAAYARIRYHRKRGNGGSYTQEEWRVLCDRFDNRCACCGELAKLTVDHIIPVIKGGTSDIQNIQPLCISCNCRKGDNAIDYRYKQAAD